MKTWLCLVLCISTSVHAEIRSIFKIEGSTNLHRMNFGLRDQQIQEIKELTQGVVDFGNVHYRDHDEDLLIQFKNEPGFSGVIYRGVPPPVEITADPEASGQWWLQKLEVPTAWSRATGKGVIIADCDAGYYHDEPDLFSNMLLEHRYDVSDLKAPLVVNDGPFASHGTSVTAIMAGVLNGLGTNGIAYDSKIVPLQNFNYNESDDLNKEEATAKCVLRAIATPGVDIIVLENQTANGSSETFVGTRDAVRLALASGIIVVSAAGNYNVELREEEKDDTGSIIVGAVLANDGPAPWTNYGKRVTIAAYGEKLHTLSEPGGIFRDFGGTSGATPQVAAAVALMKEVNPWLTPQQAQAVLTETRLQSPQTDKVGGILRVPAALEKAYALKPDLPTWAEQRLFKLRLTSILNH